VFGERVLGVLNGASLALMTSAGHQADSFDAYYVARKR
jgi:hypothetical protein